MRVVIDMQSLQTESQFRGIGRYSFSLVNALLGMWKGVDFWILINDQKEEDIVRIGGLFSGLISPEKIVSFAAPHSVNEAYSENQWRVRAAELIRSHFLEEMSPDVVITTSLMEFDAVTSVEPASKRTYKSVVILYDLIPLADPDLYLQNPLVRGWYYRKLESLKNADLLLAISDYSMTDAVNKLGLDPTHCRSISAAADKIAVGNITSINFTERHAVDQVCNESVLYVGGFDKRKNVEKLIEAYSYLPHSVQNKYRLILAGKIGNADKERLTSFASSLGIVAGNLIFTGFVPDDLLVTLYKACRLFVFPSSSEGFGLPPLEAMLCGAPVIAAERTSLIEVVGFKEALFDPENVSLFSKILLRGLTDEEFRDQLIMNGKTQTKKFSWDLSASKAIDAISVICDYIERGPQLSSGKPSAEKFQARGSKDDQELKLIESIGAIQLNIIPDKDDLVDIAKKMARNFEFVSKNISNIKKECVTLSTKFTQIDLIAGLPSIENIPLFEPEPMSIPCAFSSTLCRAQHFRMPLYTYWCNEFRETPRYHRKQWEFVYICQTLFERGYLVPGKRAVGFGVGREPLVSLFASRGVSVLASDLDIEDAKRLGWVSTNQHSDDQSDLNQLGLCEPNEFNRLVTFKNIDMNKIPVDIGCFDFCWSSCAFEHLGSIRRGLDFVLNSARLLKSGGMAVHTTEFNVSSNDRTLDNNESFVIFRRQDIELLVSELSAENFVVEAIDYFSDTDSLEQYIDMPPYQEKLHLRLQLAGEFTATSIGIIVKRP